MKRILKPFFLGLAVVMLLCVSALAAGTQSELDSGFYSIGTAANVSIEPRTAENAKVTATTATVGGQQVTDYYENAERLSVTYSGEISAGDQFVVFLVTGDALPTSDDTICYVNQVAADTGSIQFDVFPMLPNKSTDMTLFITSNREGFQTISVPLKYEKSYTLGDVNSSGGIDAIDALLALQHSAELTELIGNHFLAADVNRSGAIDAIDALLILQYAAELIDTFG